tara:strand:+ start:170 stop:331 length:162 start_codon:yes stop_codon:yes gene_type:complete
MEKNNIIYILKFIIIYNALNDGWKIKKINNNKYIFSKKIVDIVNNDLEYIIRT